MLSEFYQRQVAVQVSFGNSRELKGSGRILDTMLLD